MIKVLLILFITNLAFSMERQALNQKELLNDLTILIAQKRLVALQEHLPTITIDLLTQLDNGETILHAAVRSKSLPILIKIVEALRNQQWASLYHNNSFLFLSPRNRVGKTPVMLACQLGLNEVITYLMHQGDGQQLEDELNQLGTLQHEYVLRQHIHHTQSMSPLHTPEEAQKIIMPRSVLKKTNPGAGPQKKTRHVVFSQISKIQEQNTRLFDPEMMEFYRVLMTLCFMLIFFERYSQLHPR